MNNINGKQLRELLANDKEVVLLDVRTEQELSDGVIENAEFVNFLSSDFADKIKSKDKEKTYVLICRSGNRSGSAYGLMAHVGFKHLYNLSGGMMAWDGEVVSV